MTQATTGVARVSAVSHRYASTLALDKVELEIPSGRMVGLIGPDGVGKSTLLGILAGVRRIQTGTVQVLGGDMRNHRHRTALCPRVAYMPQGLGRNLYMTLSVFENIDFFARLFGQQRAEREWRIRELLADGRQRDKLAKLVEEGRRLKLPLVAAVPQVARTRVVDDLDGVHAARTARVVHDARGHARLHRRPAAEAADRITAAGPSGRRPVELSDHLLDRTASCRSIGWRRRLGPGEHDRFQVTLQR